MVIQLYSGWRPQELAILKVPDIDFEKNIMTGGLKTQAGKERIVPILPLIKPLLEKRYNEAIKLNSEYVFNDINSQTGINMTYDKYRKRFMGESDTRDDVSHNADPTNVKDEQQKDVIDDTREDISFDDLFEEREGK